MKDKESKKIDWVVFSIVAIGILLRILFLANRPPHHDEGVNGWFADRILSSGFYQYDPKNYHGPLLFYPIFFLQVLFGRSLWALRLPSVIAGIGTIFIALKFSKFFGRTVSLIVATCVAISPACVFYSRYVSFDTYTILFSMLIYFGIVGLWKEGLKKYLWIIAIGLVGLITSKETYILHAGCFVLSGIALFIIEKYYPTNEGKISKLDVNLDDIKKIIGISILFIFILYSGFFLTAQGVYGFLESIKNTFSTATVDSAHTKSFRYFIDLFLKYEVIALIGMLGTFYGLVNSPRWIRYIGIYGFGVFLAHSIIPYKTPWLIVTFLWPFYFVIGDIIGKLLKTSSRIYVIWGFSILLASSFFTTVKLTFYNFDNNKEPYVYVHTFKEVYKITDPIFKLISIDKSNYDLKGHVIRQNYWPLPWLLGDFPNVGYYDPGVSPPIFDADFLVVETKRIYEVEKKLKNKYFTEMVSIRDSQDKSKIYYSYEKFKTVFPDKEPDFTPNEEPLKPNQGLIAVFYGNKDWSGKPIEERNVSNVDFYWENELRPFNPPFSVKFVGEIFLHDAIKKIGIATDDGGYLELDGKKIIDDPGPHGLSEKVVDINASVGWKKITVGFYDIGGGAIVKLFWVDSTGYKTIIPSVAFRYEGVK